MPENVTLTRFPFPLQSIVEVCQLLSVRIGAPAEQGFLGSDSRGEFPALVIEAEDYARAAELSDTLTRRSWLWWSGSMRMLSSRPTAGTVSVVPLGMLSVKGIS